MKKQSGTKRGTENLIDAILAERDRLAAIKEAVGEDLWGKSNMVFYRSLWQYLMDKSTEALAGRMDVVNTIALYQEMKDFEA